MAAGATAALWPATGHRNAQVVWSFKLLPVTHGLETYSDFCERGCLHLSIAELSGKYVHAFGLSMKLVHAVRLLRNLQWLPRVRGIKSDLLNRAEEDMCDPPVISPPFLPPAAPASSSHRGAQGALVPLCLLTPPHSFALAGLCSSNGVALTSGRCVHS